MLDEIKFPDPIDEDVADLLEEEEEEEEIIKDPY